MHSLRIRFLLAIGLVAFVAVLALVSIARLLIYPQLIAHENLHADREIERVRHAVERDLAHMAATARDWANWDASYDFVLGQRPKYVEENFSQEMFEDNGHLMMVYTDTRGRPVWVVGYDPIEDRYGSCATSDGACRWMAPVVGIVQAHVRQQTGDLDSWFLGSPSAMMAATSRILPTDPTAAPSVGWLTFVRRMDGAWLGAIRDQTGIRMSLDPVPSPRTTTPRQPELVRLDYERMSVNRWLAAEPEHTELHLQAILERRDFLANWHTFHFAMLWTGILLLLVLVVVLLLLERMVLAPVRRLARFARQRREQGPDTSTLPASLTVRHDEIGSLAHELQGLLAQQQTRAQSLEQLSQHDHLTGLYNRRFLDAHLTRTLADADRRHTPMGLIVIDIDYFKDYNDHYGHPQGDRCLRRVARAMRGTLAAGEIIARAGGEEFVVVIANQPPEYVKTRAEQLRAAVARLNLRHAHSAVAARVTVSLGVTIREPDRRQDIDRLFRSADAMLYKAKLAGRNRVYCETCADTAGCDAPLQSHAS